MPAVIASATANSMHYFYPVARIKRVFRVGATWHNFQVDLHSNTFAGQTHSFYQLSCCIAIRYLLVFTIYNNFHPYSVSVSGLGRQIPLCFIQVEI